MAKRKSDTILSGQLDMFGDSAKSIKPTNMAASPIERCPEIVAPHPANDRQQMPSAANDVTDINSDVESTQEILCEANLFDVIAGELLTPPPVSLAGTSPRWLNDEWWTTAMVCAYLKLGRKAVWERNRDPRHQFPKAFHFGSMRHRWRSEEVRAWARDCLS